MKRLLIVLTLVLSYTALAQSVKWPEEKANDWYARQPWLVGANYIPATAVNQLEMWQNDTFDIDRINLELIWAENLGMNTMRVFLHDLLWKQDPGGFRKRIDKFLSVAKKHHIKPIFVLLDSCLGPVPRAVPPAPAAARRPQLALAAEPRRQRARRPETGDRAFWTMSRT